MIIRTGVDVCSIRRIQNAIKSGGSNFLRRVFTAREIEYCDSKRATRFQHYAVRFAAKEAFLKAVASAPKPLILRDVEVTRLPSGRPALILSAAVKKEARISGDTKIILSMSHEKDFAVSLVILFTMPKTLSRSPRKH
ncbi:MAG: holo-ACP synthase [Candidatus Omnitrophica bacterium]|nr:holo-ACP synthase [Candidatus Omnitrophota bacterium]